MGIKKISKIYYIFILIIFIAVVSGLYFYNSKPTYTLTFETMNTFVTASVYDKNKDNAKKSCQEIFALFNNLNDKWDSYDSSSMLFKLNNFQFFKDSTKNKDSLFTLDSMTYEVIKEAKIFNKKYDKRFNIAVGPLIKMWKRYAKIGKMPCPCTVKRIKNDLCNLDDIILDKKHHIKFMNNQISIDFGALAKGYALKKSKEIMEKNNIKYYIINAGGDIYVSSKFGFRYKVGITDPYDKSKIFKVLKVKNCGVATSGDYERSFEIEGKMFTHIIDPLTGYPSERFNSATVICKDPFYADMWATTLSMGVDSVPNDVGYFLISQDTVLSSF